MEWVGFVVTITPQYQAINEYTKLAIKDNAISKRYAMLISKKRQSFSINNLTQILNNFP